MPSSKPEKGVNDLATLYPDVAAEADGWDPSKVRPGSNKKLSWKCSKGHKWDATINSRTKIKCGCPFCSNYKVLKGFNDLETKFPEIAKEWHPTKNESLTPNDVTSASHRKVWWQCKRFKDHVWDATVANRTRGETGCRFCSNQSSKPEIRILSELKLISKESNWNYMLYNTEKELNIFLLKYLEVIENQKSIYFR